MCSLDIIVKFWLCDKVTITMSLAKYNDLNGRHYMKILNIQEKKVLRVNNVIDEWNIYRLHVRTDMKQLIMVK